MHTDATKGCNPKDAANSQANSPRFWPCQPFRPCEHLLSPLPSPSGLKGDERRCDHSEGGANTVDMPWDVCCRNYAFSFGGRTRENGKKSFARRTIEFLLGARTKIFTFSAKKRCEDCWALAFAACGVYISFEDVFGIHTLNSNQYAQGLPGGAASSWCFALPAVAAVMV